MDGRDGRLSAGYVEAVSLYEQGVAALQAHDYPRASSILRSVLSRYPNEKELHERSSRLRLLPHDSPR